MVSCGKVIFCYCLSETSLKAGCHCDVIWQGHFLLLPLWHLSVNWLSLLFHLTRSYPVPASLRPVCKLIVIMISYDKVISCYCLSETCLEAGCHCDVMWQCHFLLLPLWNLSVNWLSLLFHLTRSYPVTASLRPVCKLIVIMISHDKVISCYCLSESLRKSLKPWYTQTGFVSTPLSDAFW
jgi:hypothetical protein